jgi:hypothetical protein
MEEGKNRRGEMKDWKTGRLGRLGGEDWKDGRLEGWKRERIGGEK